MHTNPKPPLRSTAAGIAIGALLLVGLSACKDRPDGQMSDRAAAGAPMQSENLGAALNDTGITAQVKGRLASDARTQPANISVETNNGVVTLSGSAPNPAAKNAAEELARMVPDVKGVNNRINAPSAAGNMADNMASAARQAGDSIDDAWITTKVKSSLLADSQTKGSKIEVETEQGVVTLSGTTRSEAEHKQAVEIAKGIEGVRAVDDSDLTVVR